MTNLSVSRGVGLAKGPRTDAPDGGTNTTHTASKAFWAMVRRVTLVAASIDVGYLLLFMWLGSPVLTVINVASIAMYLAAYALIGRRHNFAGLVLIWIEVIVHSALGSLLIGWDSGFHYYLLLFIPAIVIANTRGFAVPMVVSLLAYYLGLNSLCNYFGPLTPLSAPDVRLVFWIHVCLVFGMFASISAYYRGAIVRSERRLFKQATSDPLTGLYNRGHFYTLASGAMARSKRTGESVALLLADVDFFKHVNDQHGHDVGDRVLQHVAQTIKNNLRECDSLARWGGEEFLALMPTCSATEALEVAQRIRLAVESSSIKASSTIGRVTLSIGIATIRHADDLEAAIVRVDRALYSSKHGGRNQVSTADDA